MLGKWSEFKCVLFSLILMLHFCYTYATLTRHFRQLSLKWMLKWVLIPRFLFLGLAKHWKSYVGEIDSWATVFCQIQERLRCKSIDYAQEGYKKHGLPWTCCCALLQGNVHDWSSPQAADTCDPNVREVWGKCDIVIGWGGRNKQLMSHPWALRSHSWATHELLAHEWLMGSSCHGLLQLMCKTCIGSYSHTPMYINKYIYIYIHTYVCYVWYDMYVCILPQYDPN